VSDLVERLTGQLEAVLAADDPRPGISAYHNMPYALFRYDPADEFELRRQVTMLQTRLEQSGKRVLRISLADCLAEAMTSVQPLKDWFEVERRRGTALVVDTIHTVLAEEAPLVEMVVNGMPDDADPSRDVVFIMRTGSLFPVYRTFSLLEQLSGRVIVPTVLFYPGTLDGAAGLRFMGVLEAEHNYRPKIF
jgi:Domain of unknown function (DUF1788)